MRFVGVQAPPCLPRVAAAAPQVPATLGHETTFTYIGVRDAAAAIVAALHRGKTGRRYLVRVWGLAWRRAGCRVCNCVWR